MVQLELDEIPQTDHGPCAWCDGPAQGNYVIHTAGVGIGELRQLCDSHGRSKSPSAKQIRVKLRAERERGKAA